MRTGAGSASLWKIKEQQIYMTVQMKCFYCTESVYDVKGL